MGRRCRLVRKMLAMVRVSDMPLETFVVVDTLEYT